MLLRSLKLENFRQHRDTHIVFEPGMTAIIGLNGSGKSTLLEAIGYALYGRIQTKKEDLPNHWSESKKYSVNLEFELDTHQFRADRSESAAVVSEFVDGAWHERTKGPDNVSAHVERLLGLNYSRFNNSFCALQKELEFLKGNATDRRDEISKMLGLDDLKVAEARAREIAKAKKDALGGAETISIGATDELEEDLTERRARLAEIAEDLAALQNQLLALSEKAKASETHKARAMRFQTIEIEIGRLETRLQSQRENLKSRQSRLTQLRADAEESAALQPLLEAWAKLEAEDANLERVRSAQEAQVKAFANLEAERKQLEQLIAESVGPSLDEATQTLHRWREKAEIQAAALAAKREESRAAAANLGATEERVRAAKEQVQKSEAWIAQGKCPTCGKPFDQSDQARFQTERHELKIEEAQLVAAKAEHTRLIQELNSLEAESFAEELNKARADLEAAKKKEAWQQKLSVLAEATQSQAEPYDASRHQAIKAELVILKPKRERALALEASRTSLTAEEAEATELAAEIARGEAARDDLKTEQEALGFENSEEAKQAENEAEVAKAQLTSLQRTINAQTQRQSETEAGLKAIENQLKEASELETRKKRYQYEADLFAEIQKQLRNLRDALNQQLQPQIKLYAEDFLARLTEGRYTSIDLNEKMDAAIIDEGETKPLISGGEQDVLALALRLALSRILQERQRGPVGLLILDEVFASLDSQRRDLVLNCLQSLRSETGQFSQIIVISHIVEINEVADHCLYLSYDKERHATIVSDRPAEELPIAEGLKTGLFEL